MKKTIMLILSVVTLMITVSNVVTGQNDKTLVCDDNGDFTILIVSDPQCDNINQWREARDELETLIQKANPNFVLINGDMNSKNQIPVDMWDLFITPIEDRKIFWSTTNGNHDPFNYKIYKMYKSYERCLNNIVSTSDENYDCMRPMNYMLPVYSNNKKNIVFAIYGMDSGVKDENGYVGLTNKQVDWYTEKSNDLKKLNNEKAVTSVICMHIPLPQMLEMFYGEKCIVYGVANEINYNHKGYITKSGKFLPKINVHTSNYSSDTKIFDAVIKQGDVKAIIFGHNHRNNFIGSYNGVLLGFAGKLSTGCYSDSICRGGRVIKFNQDKPEQFITYWLSAIESGHDQPPILSDGTMTK